MPCPGQVLPVTRNRSVDARSSGRGSGFDWLIEAVDADAISYPPAVLHQDAASRIHRIASRPEASRGPPRAPHLDFATAFPGNGTMFFFLMTISTTPIYPKPHPVLSQATEARPLWACAATPHLVGPRPGDTFPPSREHHSSRARRNQMTRRTFTAQRTCPPRSIDWANLPSWLIPICSSQFSGGRPAPTAAC
jgi:hypothetical protein